MENFPSFHAIYSHLRIISSKSALENIIVGTDNFRKFSVFTEPCSRRSACGFFFSSSFFVNKKRLVI